MALIDNIEYHPTNQLANDIVRSNLEPIKMYLDYLFKGAEYEDVILYGKVVIENEMVFIRNAGRINETPLDIGISDYLANSENLKLLLNGIPLYSVLN